MKTLKIAALVLGFALIALPPAQASEGFFDLYGGFSKFSNMDATNSYVPYNNGGPSAGEQDTDFPNTKVLDSYVGGFRAGGTAKWDQFNLSLAYDNSFYSVGAIANGNQGFPANKDVNTVYYQDAQGGFVIQPGVQVLAGIPLRYFRVYGGVGLVVPIMFYNYTSADTTGLTVTPGQLGMSGAIGGDIIFGGRWFITKRLNLLVEDRIQTMFTPMVIKNSIYDPATGGWQNSSFTMKTLNANQVLIGIGYAWGS